MSPYSFFFYLQILCELPAFTLLFCAGATQTLLCLYKILIKFSYIAFLCCFDCFSNLIVVLKAKINTQALVNTLP